MGWWIGVNQGSLCEENEVACRNDKTFRGLVSGDLGVISRHGG